MRAWTLLTCLIPLALAAVFREADKRKRKERRKERMEERMNEIEWPSSPT
jgi:hypothetical protein